MEIIGFLFLCVLNMYLSITVIFIFAHGGGDLGPLLTGWVSTWEKLSGIGLLISNIFLWYILYQIAPFTLTFN